MKVILSTCLTFHDIGVKGITSFLLCRLGVAKARTQRAFNSAQWNVDIGRLSETEITVLYQNVISRIKKHEKYGGYDAVQYMMGSKTAELLAKSGFVNRRPICEAIEEMDTSNMGGEGRKRMEREWEEEEDYVNAEIAGKQQSKRKMVHLR